MATTSKRRGRPAVRFPCEYCGEPITAYEKTAHLRYSCQKVPTSEEEATLPPGTIMDVGTGAPRKVAWTWDSLKKDYPEAEWKTIIPVRTQDVTINGLRMRFIEGQEMKVPACHYDVYMRSLENDRNLLKGVDPSVRVIGVGPLIETAAR